MKEIFAKIKYTTIEYDFFVSKPQLVTYICSFFFSFIHYNVVFIVTHVALISQFDINLTLVHVINKPIIYLFLKLIFLLIFSFHNLHLVKFTTNQNNTQVFEYDFCATLDYLKFQLLEGIERECWRCTPKLFGKCTQYASVTLKQREMLQRER